MKSAKNVYAVIVGMTLITLTSYKYVNDSLLESEFEIQNVAPFVLVSGNTALEGSSVSITANGQDSDGTIASYAWTQKLATTAVLSGIDSATVNFLAPAVLVDSEMVLTITVTDDDGATASSDVTVSITANIMSVTVNGLITGGLIPNANINVSVGDQSFTTKADENGVYSVEISLDDSYSDQVVNVTATGEEAESPVKLVSLLGDFATVDSAGGDDDIVTKNELFNVNVTNMSTATAALMEDANNDQAIIDSTQYSDAAKGFDSSLVLPLATAIKLVIDFSAENSELVLPDGIDDTFALVSNLDAASEYVINAQTNAAEAYAQAQSEIFADDEVVSGGSSYNGIPIADIYYQIAESGSIAGDRIILKEDGSGNISLE